MNREEQKGLIQVYTGNGKGKTTAALGQALRAVGHGYKVLIIQFAKGSPDYGEIKASQILAPYLKIEQYGLETFIDKDNLSKEDIELAQKGWNVALNAITDNAYNMVILDELNIALDFHLLDLKEVIEALNRRNPTIEIIITGRYAHQAIIDIADTVSEVKLIKHHYYNGIVARAGIEF